MSDGEALHAAEAWFTRHGLPYFVDEIRSHAARNLSLRVYLPVVFVSLVAAVVAGVLARDDEATGLLVGFLTFGACQVLYGLTRLKAGPMARWAIARTFSSLGLLFPLVTRALPLLLLFMTFLFINTEVWQVASSLDNGVLWVAVLLFAAVAVGFLLVRLPEELDRVDDELSGHRLLDACAGTPLEEAAHRYSQHDVVAAAQVRGYEKGNLVFVLLVTQAVQVLLLSVAVYFFFVVFGAVAIREPVMESWLGEGQVHWVVADWPVVSWELLQVSTFLAAFAGLYFTVYAVSDENYRRQFFASLMRELERAVGVRTVYRLLKDD